MGSEERGRIEENLRAARAALGIAACIKTLVKAEADEIAEEAETAANEFWRQHNRVRRERPNAEHGRYGVRIERRAVGVSIRWYRFRFVGPKGKAKPAHQYLGRGKGYRVAEGLFKGAQPWELGAIGNAENTFERLRYRVELWARVLKLLGGWTSWEKRAVERVPDVPDLQGWMAR